MECFVNQSRRCNGPLWDHSPIGLPVIIQPIKSRMSVLIKDRVLSLGCRFVENHKLLNGVFLGTVQSEKRSGTGTEGGGGAILMIDRFEESIAQEKKHHLMNGDLRIPFKLQKNISNHENDSEDFETVRLRSLYGSGVESCPEMNYANFFRVSSRICLQGPNCSISVDVQTFDISFKAQPLMPVPLSTTANSIYANLRGQEQICSRLQTGFLSLSVAKSGPLILMSETDPRLSTCPLVGIWISGVNSIFHLFSWTACLRYAQCQDYTQKLCNGGPSNGGPFLLLLFTSSSTPLFYDCFSSCPSSSTSVANEQQQQLEFSLLRGHANINVPKVPSFSTNITKINLEIVQNPKKGNKLVLNSGLFKDKGISSRSSVVDVPRKIPNPTFVQCVFPFVPSVPDLSLLSERMGPPINRDHSRDSRSTLTNSFPGGEKAPFEKENRNSSLSSSSFVDDFFQRPKNELEPSNSSSTISFQKAIFNSPRLAANFKQCQTPEYLQNDQLNNRPTSDRNKHFYNSNVSRTPSTSLLGNQKEIDNSNVSLEPLSPSNQNIRIAKNMVISKHGQNNGKEMANRNDPKKVEWPSNPSNFGLINEPGMFDVDLNEKLSNQDEQLKQLKIQIEQLIEKQNEAREAEIEKPFLSLNVSQAPPPPPPSSNAPPPSSCSEPSKADPELISILKHQDEQLKMLQVQIQSLLSKQNEETFSSSSSAKCSVGIMTSFLTVNSLLVQQRTKDRFVVNSTSSASTFATQHRHHNGRSRQERTCQCSLGNKDDKIEQKQQHQQNECAIRDRGRRRRVRNVNATKEQSLPSLNFPKLKDDDDDASESHQSTIIVDLVDYSGMAATTNDRSSELEGEEEEEEDSISLKRSLQLGESVSVFKRQQQRRREEEEEEDSSSSLEEDEDGGAQKMPTKTFYQQMLGNVQDLLDNCESLESEKGARSGEGRKTERRKGGGGGGEMKQQEQHSLMLPKINYETLHLIDSDDYEEEHAGEQLSLLVHKYLGKSQEIDFIRKCGEEPQSLEKRQQNVSIATEAYFNKHISSAYCDSSSLPVNASVATEDYLKKYFPLKKEAPLAAAADNYKRSVKSGNLVPFLDIEELKRQPKLL